MDLVTRLFARRNIVVPVVVGVVAVLLGGLFAFITLRVDDDTEQASAPKVTTRSFVSEAGGYAIDVPTDLEESRQGRAATFSAKDKSLVVTVGPSEAGPLRPASRRYLRTLRAGYDAFQLLGKQDETIDGRPALAAYGQVTNENRVRIRFVAVVVRADPTNYTITAFTSFDSDPAVVLPRVNAIVNSFSVQP